MGFYIPIFPFFQPLSKVPKLFTPAVAFPKCAYPNDEHFRFCQRCGYARRLVVVPDPPSRVEIDETMIGERLQRLSKQNSSSSYSRQKNSLEKELVSFMSSLSSPKSLASALPSYVIAFPVWKDRNGKTLVHLPDCVRSVHTTSLQPSCSCPRRLAFGTVDALIGKLRSIFVTQGRGPDWQPLLGVGNPAACRTVQKYLADVKEEQLKSRIVPRQAEPVLLADLAVISRHIETRLLQSSSLEPSQIFVLARDQMLVKALFFAGDRAADLLQLKTGDILRFPDNSGFLLNHIWTKTLLSGDKHVFAFKRGSNKMVYPVGGLELYVRICGLLGIELGSGYLFRPLSKTGTVSSQCMTSQAAQTRLNVYSVPLRQQLTGEHFTLHGFMS